MKKTIGILGGMGPLATAELLRSIVLLSDAAGDNDHIPVLVDNNTRIPDRTAAILHGGANPRPELIRSAQRLQAMGADFLIMPCNTAHYFLGDIKKSVRIPFIDMIAETVREAQRRGYRKVGVLSTAGTSESGVYDRAFEAAGIAVVKPDEEEQRGVTSVIYDGVKAGNFALDASDFKAVAQKLYGEGAEALVLGCTELPIAFEKFAVAGATIDPAYVLAARAIEAAGGRVKTK